MQIDWDTLWEHLAGQFALGEHSIHGTEHWHRVERHAVRLAEHSSGDILVVRLFAVFHDVCRQNDGSDEAHGARGAELATRLRGQYFELPDESFAQLHYACTWHTSGQLSEDPTIGACWDADRLDIWRAGYTPHERYMSTQYARQLVRARKVGPQHTPPML
ncbi:MAG: HD domain-containing protein [Armatimonadota bacterium]